ncbi:hypothetical protein [Methylocystis parvus]|uniref:BA14K family protein n=1 Tax=Methylocystis parvus TaxID=134 RepID=A0A6B8M8T6_9HYPH|nr:hypothetical protein [Methylocystis parvus]QGM98805.1 hypothetical protein F7D14_15815 [Methylocystis parvus]WBK00845.1 hypothetical protein MMG94_03740 [Methylocystis parvus OBBP]
MRFISGIRAVAVVGALALAPGASLAQAGGGHGGGGGGGFGGGGFGHGLPATGVGAYARGQGPTGAAGLGLGANRHGVLNGFWGGYGGGGGGDAISQDNQTNVYTYNHFDNRRRDGGFYGGGGVFYPDDGYSRLYTIRPPGGYEDAAPVYGPTGYAPQTVYRPSQHIFYLPDNNRRATRKHARHEGGY